MNSLETQLKNVIEDLERIERLAENDGLETFNIQSAIGYLYYTIDHWEEDNEPR